LLPEKQLFEARNKEFGKFHRWLKVL